MSEARGSGDLAETISSSEARCLSYLCKPITSSEARGFCYLCQPIKSSEAWSLSYRFKAVISSEARGSRNFSLATSSSKARDVRYLCKPIFSSEAISWIDFRSKCLNLYCGYLQLPFGDFRFGLWLWGLEWTSTVPNHQSDIFVRPKKVSLFWKM